MMVGNLLIFADSEVPMKMKFLIIISVMLALTLAACGADGPPSDAGEELFARSILDDQPGCITCHSLESDVIIIGPSVTGIASRAGDMVSGMSAEEYLKQSIVDPNAYLVPGFPQDTMPPVWGERLSEKQVDELVAYMMTLQ
jgi:mono/diheme cytochrome c family protein